MSDFLKNLRNSGKKDPSNPKKNLDGHYYSQNEHKKNQEKRPDYSEALESLFACLTDVLPKFSDSTTAFVQSLEKAIRASDLLIEAKIRQHDSVTVFFDNLNKLFSNDFIPVEAKDSKTTASYASGTHYTKDEILSLIKTMRTKDATFATIAEYLKEKGIPTFSGRGEWHAQTVHRLCK
ncbi:MAG: hypothetical protein WC836_04995 [Desulfobacula sp.]|jgi:hypothetical protein